MAVALPYFQKRADEEEKLNVWMRTNMGGIVKLSDDPSKTSAVQIPWLFTLSNTGKVKLSIIGFDLRQIIGEAHRKFPGLTGTIADKNGNSLLMPVSLDAGESITLRMHIGFLAGPDILKPIYELHEKMGAFTLKDAFLAFAKERRTIYGGKAEFEGYEGGHTVKLSPDFFLSEPVYRVEFTTGRGNSFLVQTSDTISKWQQLTRP